MDRRVRILYYNHTRKVSGGERMLLLMLTVLDRTSYEPLAACPLEGDGNLDELLRDAGVEIIPAPLLQARFTSNPLHLLRYLASIAATILAFRKTIRNAAPDLLHASSVRAGIVATLATVGTNMPVLWHVQDDLPAHLISTPIRLLAFFSRRTRLVAVSAATAKAFAGKLPFAERLRVLHNAVDRARFPRKASPLDPAAASFRTELELKAGDFLIATVGMINPRKGLVHLVEAFAEVAGLKPNAHLAIVGAPIFNNDALYEAQVHARSRELGLTNRVHFTGSRSDVPAILRAADLFVLNATIEPFGLVILEAMSSGTPVIATAVGGIPEIVENGVTGELVPSKNNEILSERIGRLIDKPRSRLADAAYESVLPRFSIEVFSANLHRIYASLNLGGGAA